jgi:hypothetical protein
MDEHREPEGVAITLRYIDGDEDLVIRSAVAEAVAHLNGLHGHSDALKWRQLGRLGIERHDSERPMDAWLRAMAETNGLPHTTPTHLALTAAILGSRKAARFLIWLA